MNITILLGIKNPKNSATHLKRKQHTNPHLQKATPFFRIVLLQFSLLFSASFVDTD